MPTTRRDSWWGVVLVLAAVATIIWGIVAAWRTVALLPPTAAERYMPLSAGLTLRYQVTRPDGVAYQTSNVERYVGSAAVNSIDTPTQQLIIARAYGVAPDELSDEQVSGFWRDKAAAFSVARVTDTTIDATGIVTPSVSVLLVEPTLIALLNADGQALKPPLPLFDPLLGEAPRIVTGTLGFSTPYTATIANGPLGPLDTPVGALSDCRRVQLDFATPDFSNATTTWYCAGIGAARQELRAGTSPARTRYELVGASTPSATLAASGEAAPPRPAQQPVAASTAASDVVSGTIQTRWSYQEPGGGNLGITTTPVAFGNLLLYGTANGGVLAIDRVEHTRRWRFQTGAAVYGAPTLADGTVYVGSTDRRLYALDAQSGVPLWIFPTGDSINASPAVSNGVVYVGSEDRTLYAIDAASGRERWRFQAGDAIVAAPIVADDTLYVGSDDGVLYALDAATGASRWRFATGDAITGAAAVANGVVVVGSNDGALYGLRADTAQPDGAQLWRYELGEPIVANVAVAGETAFAVAVGELHAVRLADGQGRWQFTNPNTFQGAPVVLGGAVLARRGADILAFDAADGAQRWVAPTGDPPADAGVGSDGREIFVGHRGGFLRVMSAAGAEPWALPHRQAAALANELFELGDTLASPPVAYGDGAIIISTSGHIFHLAADGSHEQWGRAADLQLALRPPVVAGDTLYLGNEYGKLIAFDLRARRELWRADVAGRTFSPPAVQNGRVLLAHLDDDQIAVTAFDAASGQEVWQKQFPFAFGVGSSALLHNGRFLIVADRVIALDPTSGEQLWQGDSDLRPFQITAHGNSVYAVAFDDSFSGALVALDDASGKQRYQAPLNLTGLPGLQGGMAADDTSVVLTLNDRTLVAVDATSGRERWRKRGAAEFFGAPVLHNGAALLIDADEHLIARALDDGRLVGDFALQSTNALDNSSTMAPRIVDGALYGAFYRTAFVLPLRR